MKKPIFSILNVLIIYSLIINGCDTTSSNSNSQKKSAATTQKNSTLKASQGSVKQKNFDERLLSLSKAIPSFGGIYYKDGKPVIYLRNQKERKKALSSIKNRVSSLSIGKKFSAQLVDIVNNPELKVKKATYGFKQLYSWRKRAFEMLHSMDGIVSFDVDDRKNRVLIGLHSLSIKQKVQKKLKQIHIPLKGIIFEKRKPAEELSLSKKSKFSYANLQNNNLSLRSRHRPIYGGIQIQYSYSGITYICTMGSPVENYFINNHERYYGFLTASHCTNDRRNILGIEYYQPTTNVYNSHVGVEYDEMPYYSDINGFYGDAAFIKTDSALQVSNRIPRTVKWTSNCYLYSTDCTENPNNTHFTMYGYGGNEFVGKPANKVGRTTGWTNGTITNNCLDIVGDDGYWNKCNVVVERPSNRHTHIADHGDSGAPVFQLYNSGGDPVYAEDGSRQTILTGVLWGGNPQDFSKFYYTSFSGDLRNSHGMGYHLYNVGGDHRIVRHNPYGSIY